MLRGVVMVALAAASWGTWSLFLRPTGLPATVTSPIMFAIMGLVALPISLRDRDPLWDRTTIALVAANTLTDGLNVIFFFGAMSTTTVAVAVLTHYMAPVLIALAAPRIDGTRTRHAVPAAIVALCGLMIMLEPWRTPAQGALLGASLGFASAICYAANVFVVRRAAERIGPARAMSYHSLAAAVLMLPLALSGLATVRLPDLALLAVGSSTIGALSGIVFVIGLARIGAARASILTFAEPVVAIAVGALVWDEPVRPLAALGGALVLGAGIHVANQAR